MKLEVLNLSKSFEKKEFLKFFQTVDKYIKYLKKQSFYFRENII